MRDSKIMDETVDFLERTELLSKVPRDHIAALAYRFQPVVYAAGTVIFRENDPGDALYLVREGLVRVERGGIPVAFRRSGECVGEMALLDQSPRSSTLVAQTKTELLRLPAEDFAEIAASHPQVISGIHRVLSAKLRESLPSSGGTTSVVAEDSQHPHEQGVLLPKELAGALFAGRYQMENLLGTGGMAHVYRALDKLLDVPVAVKILHRIDEETILERFKQEVLLARKVVHPNVCRIFDFGVSNGLHYVSMEYIDGLPLVARLRKRLARDEAIGILKQVLAGLSSVHQLGIVHRDMKPHNIMLEETGRAVIMDFGIAVWTHSVTRLTATGQFIGTLHYMAPEQYEGTVDPRSDLYSVGIMMYEMFTGRRPFETGSTAAMIHSHLHQVPRRPREVLRDIPRKLERIILKAMEKDPEARFQSAADLLETLNSLKL